MTYHPMLRITKAGLKEKADNTVWMIASTEDRDEEGEELVQKAMDLSYMTRDGKVTWGHSPQYGPIHPENILGEITLARLEPAGVYIEAVFMPWKEKAAIILNDLRNSNESGIALNVYKASIEGQYRLAYGPNGKIQKSAIIRNVALDTNVVNTHTMIGLLKSTQGRECNCAAEMQELSTARQKVRSLIEHMVICKGVNDFNVIRRILTAKICQEGAE